MNTDVAERKETMPAVAQMVIVMKSGLTFWVSKETAERAQEALASQTAHRFMRIAELGETINTAEIEGIYGPERYEELQRSKNGEYKCQWGTWHTRKDRCDCKNESMKRARQEADRLKREAESRPLTPEEQAMQQERWRKGNEMAALNGSDVFRGIYQKGRRSGKRIRRSTIVEWEQANGREANVADLSIEEDVL